MSGYDIFDFDNTIYRGDASLDFYLFCLKRRPALIKYVPTQLWHALKFACRLEDRTRFKSHFFIFLKDIKNGDRAVQLFWEVHFKKVKAWYMDRAHEQDIIISASPEFLLEPAASKLKVKALLATRMDIKTGRIRGKNCRGEEKVRRYREAFGTAPIDSVYTDSMADKPLLQIAKQPFVVRGDKIRQY